MFSHFVLAIQFLLTARTVSITISIPIDEYDFVIIGGGASGLAVANRLTENTKVNVLVVERGPLDQGEPSAHVPGLLNLTSTPYWYDLFSAPQANLNNRTFRVPCAKVVGGGTLINGMFMHRGSAADYDAWRELGNPGWGWRDLLPYFKKCETFTEPDKQLRDDYNITYVTSSRGHGGPLSISYPVFQFPAVRTFFQAWKKLGFSPPTDPASGKVIGPNYVSSSLTPKNQSRASARVAYYDPVKNRNNLHLLPEHIVTRINFVEKRAVGVEIASATNNTIKRTISAKNEVILAAGVHSSQLLQLSGIGPAGLLQKHGINTVVDLNGVGRNFQDHPVIWNFVKFKEQVPHPNAQDLIDFPNYAAEQLKLYDEKREGAYTLVSDGGNVAAFISLAKLTNESASIIDVAKQPDPSWSKIESHDVLAGYKKQQEAVVKLLSDPTEPVWESGYNTKWPDPNVHVRPLSRGSIEIKSANVFDEPVVDFNTFSHPADLEILVAIVYRYRDLIAALPFAEWGPTETVPGANLTTKAQIRDALRKLAGPTFQHPCCSNSMMPRELGGVVDPELKVYGTEGLRVVDASIQPLIISSHTTLSVYTVAEKAADLIKKEYGTLLERSTSLYSLGQGSAKALTGSSKARSKKPSVRIRCV